MVCWNYYPGPSCSKLTTSLVKDSLKFTSSDTQICLNFFAEKMWVATATHIFFFRKNIRILYIESAKTINEKTLIEFVKLTTLWTTGLSMLSVYSYSLQRTEQYEEQRGKIHFWHVRPTKTQISLRIRAVWSVFVVRMKKLCLSYPKWRNFASLPIQNASSLKIVIRLRGCTGWSESSLGAHVWRFIFLTLRHIHFHS